MSRHGIVTPEAVVLDFEPAGVASRIVARLVDVAALLAIVYSLLTALVVMAANSSETVIIIGIVVLAFLAVFAYPAVFEALGHGRTLGKMATGLRVVTIEGAPVRFRHTSVRSMMQVIDIIITLGGAAVVSSILSPLGQRLGDMLAGTLVIKERRVAATLAERAVRFPNPVGLDGLVRSIDPSPLGPEQAALLRGFLIRVTELDPAARSAFAVRLSKLVSDRLGQPIAPDVHPETWLACVAAALQRRSEEATTDARPSAPPPLAPRSSLQAPPAPPGSVAKAHQSSDPGWVPPS